MPQPNVMRIAAAAVFSAVVFGCEPTVVIGARVEDAGGGGGNGVDSGVGADGDRADADATLMETGAGDGASDSLVAMDTGGQDSTLDTGADARGGVCPDSGGNANPVPDPDASVGVPWATGFENGFCDYAPPLGFCLVSGTGSFSIVTSPVHSGQYAAAFSVRGDGDGGQGQARCVQQGVFPGAAYYSAWYYLPAPAVNNHLWNLFHFQGGVAGSPLLQGLWDVSLDNLSDGGPLHVTFFDFLTGSVPNSSAAPPIPIGQWFRLEVYFKRAKDATGELSMWQDGVLAVHLTGLVTDNTDWGQWYVGNLADALLPPTSTIYVDDVTIGLTP